MGTRNAITAAAWVSSGKDRSKKKGECVMREVVGVEDGEGEGKDKGEDEDEELSKIRIMLSSFSSTTDCCPMASNTAD